MSSFDKEPVLDSVRRLHEAIRVAVWERLQEARVGFRPELADRPGDWGAGDVSYAVDDVAEAALTAFGEDLARLHPLTLVSEGPGVVPFAGPSGAVPLRALIDPIDGTRSLMHDMRSAWALTGVAVDGGEATRLSDIEVAMQTELPTTSAAVYHVLIARKGAGARIERRAVVTGELLEEGPLQTPAELSLENGYVSFTRYLAVERPLVAELERSFLEHALTKHELDPRLMYDDQYLCSAGQLYLVTTGRYRMLADLRGWLRRTHQLANFTAKPYDLSALLIYREAGAVVLDEAGADLDAPFDTETALSVVAYPNAALRAAFEPSLRVAMESLR